MTYNWMLEKLLKLELVTPDGRTYVFHDPPRRTVWNDSGWGLSDRELTTTKGPFQHGESPVSINLSPRLITLTFRHQGDTFTEFWTNRTAMLNALRENLSSLTDPQPSQLLFYYYQNDAITIRALDVYIQQGPPFSPTPLDRWDSWSIQETVTFIALNPIVYDPALISTTIDLNSEELVLPVTLPFVLGCYSFGAIITYTGTWEEFPTIVVVGPAKNVGILNTTLGLRINLSYELASEEIVTFDLAYNKKTVDSNCVGNLNAYIDDSQLGTFVLQCDPLAVGGVNTIVVYSDVCDIDQTAITFQYHTRYRGI